MTPPSHALEARLRALADQDQLHQVAEEGLRAYGGELYGFLARSMDNPDEADEVYAQTCADIWAGLERFRWRCSFRTWAYRLARSARARFARDGYAHRRVSLLTDELEQVIAQARTATLPWLRTHFRHEIASIRAELSEDDRALLYLRIDRRMSWPEIAAALDDSEDPATLKRAAQRLRTRYHRLKNHIRDQAQHRGLLTSR